MVGRAADRGVDVLIAEDNEVNQLVFSFLMEEIGLSFVIVSNGREAVEQYRLLKPRIIVMDISMSIMNGMEAARLIRESERGTDDHVPIIAATAHALKGDAEKFMAAGIDDYISKPLSPERFRKKILRWMHADLEIAND